MELDTPYTCGFLYLLLSFKCKHELMLHETKKIRWSATMMMARLKSGNHAFKRH